MESASAVSKVNSSHLHKCFSSSTKQSHYLLITFGYWYQKNFYFSYTKSLDMKKISMELKIPSAVKYQCCRRRVPPR